MIVDIETQASKKSLLCRAVYPCPDFVEGAYGELNADIRTSERKWDERKSRCLGRIKRVNKVFEGAGES